MIAKDIIAIANIKPYRKYLPTTGNDFRGRS